MRNWAVICALGGLLEPRDLWAHPHIFVDAGLEVIFDADATPKALRISWVYDPLFSMLLLSDMGLDADFDGMLHGDELARLQGFDMNWIEGYHGDTHAMQSGEALSLSGPEQSSSDYENGRLRSSHLRRFLDSPEPGQPWTVSIHDPSYYTRYTLSEPPVITGAPQCMADLVAPDLEMAEAQLLAALDDLAAKGADAEADFPAVGALFAETVRISCAPQ